MRDLIAPLADPRVRPILLGQLLGRFTAGMMVLAIVFAVREAGHPYAIAGLVAGGHQLGVALGSPLQGRIADAIGHRRVLVPDGVMYLVGTIVLALALRAGLAGALATAIAVLVGLVSPPMTACTRAALGAIYGTGRDRERAFVLTVVNVEIGFIVGPLLTAAVAATLGGSVAVVVAGGCVAAGALVYASAPRDPATGPHGSLRAALHPDGFVAVLRTTGLVAMGAAFLTVAMSFGAFDLFVASVSEVLGQPSLAGTYLAIVAATSLIGGLAYGARVHPRPLRVRMRGLALLLALALLPIPLVASDRVLLGVALAVAGAVIGPMNVCGFQLVDDLSPASGRAEAQSWMQAAVYLGGALGGIAAGTIIDLVDLRLTMMVGAVGALATVAILGTAGTLRSAEAVGRTAS